MSAVLESLDRLFHSNRWTSRKARVTRALLPSAAIMTAGRRYSQAEGRENCSNANIGDRADVINWSYARM